MRNNWLAVACAEHVRRGRTGGFMQVCHGKAAPLRRIRPGDAVVYYSPTVTFGARDTLQAFTAIGLVRNGEPYLCDKSGGFRPYRRDVAWLDGEEAPIRPLLDRLDLTAGEPRWGYRLRFGLLPLGARDLGLITDAMGVRLPEPERPVPEAPHAQVCLAV